MLARARGLARGRLAQVRAAAARPGARLLSGARFESAAARPRAAGPGSARLTPGAAASASLLPAALAAAAAAAAAAAVAACATSRPACAAAPGPSPAPSPAHAAQVGGVRNLSEEPGFASIINRLLGRVRDVNSEGGKFRFFADRLMRILVEVALGELEHVSKQASTPTGAAFTAFEFAQPVTAVSILRSGDALMNSFSACMPHAPTGKLLLVKHEHSSEERADNSDIKVLYSKMPRLQGNAHQVLLLDPLMATGETMVLALRLLTGPEHKVAPSRIVCVTMISCKQGIKRVREAFPEVRIVTAAVDGGLDENDFVTPGLGSFGDRYFSTR